MKHYRYRYFVRIDWDSGVVVFDLNEIIRPHLEGYLPHQVDGWVPR